MRSCKSHSKGFCNLLPQGYTAPVEYEHAFNMPCMMCSRRDT